jgi:hypothetical protein
MFNSFGVRLLSHLFSYSCSIPSGLIRKHLVQKDVGNGQSLKLLESWRTQRTPQYMSATASRKSGKAIFFINWRNYSAIESHIDGFFRDEIEHHKYFRGGQHKQIHHHN